MKAITTIGLDIAKSVFQVHCVDAEGNVLLRRQLKRRYTSFSDCTSECGMELFKIPSQIGREGTKVILKY